MNHTGLKCVMTSLLCASVLLFTAQADAAKKVDLALHLKAGHHYQINMLMDQHIDENIRGQPYKMHQKIGMGIDYAVEKVDPDGAMHVKITYNATLYYRKSVAGTIDYDSKDKSAAAPTSPMAQAYAGMLGQGFDATFMPNGKVVEVKGCRKMIDAMIDHMNLSPAVKARMAPLLRKHFNDARMKDQLERMMGLYPGHAVAIGGKWSKSVDTRLTMPMHHDSTWTLDSIDKGQAAVKVTSQLSPIDDNDKKAALNDMGIVAKLTGKASGKIIMALDTGLIRNSDIHMTMHGPVTISPKGGNNSIKVQMDIDSQIKITGHESKS